MVRLLVTSRNEAIVAVGDGLLPPHLVVSIGGPNRQPPVIFQKFEIPTIRLAFDDVPRDMFGNVAPTFQDVETFLGRVGESWNLVPMDVIIHCEQGLSRSAAICLAIRAKLAGLSGTETISDIAEQAVKDLIADVRLTFDLKLREDAVVFPNPRIVWHADTILGLDGHLLAHACKTFNIQDVWARLGAKEPANWRKLYWGDV